MAIWRRNVWTFEFEDTLEEHFVCNMGPWNCSQSVELSYRKNANSTRTPEIRLYMSNSSHSGLFLKQMVDIYCGPQGRIVHIALDWIWCDPNRTTLLAAFRPCSSMAPGSKNEFDWEALELMAKNAKPFVYINAEFASMKRSCLSYGLALPMQWVPISRFFGYEEPMFSCPCVYSNFSHGPMEEMLEVAYHEGLMFCDFAIVCKGQSFRCHKFILVECSEYFATMLKMTCSVEAETSTIHVNSFPCVVEGLLFFIYGGTMPWKDLLDKKVDGGLYLISFLELTHLFMIEKVKSVTIHWATGLYKVLKTSQGSYAKEIAWVALLYNLDHLFEVALRHIAFLGSLGFYGKSKLSLHPNYQALVFKVAQEANSSSSEDDRWEAIDHWRRMQGPSYQPTVVDWFDDNDDTVNNDETEIINENNDSIVMDEDEINEDGIINDEDEINEDGIINDDNDGIINDEDEINDVINYDNDGHINDEDEINEDNNFNDDDDLHH